MQDMRVLIDTNVFLDMFQKRQPFENDAVSIITACVDGRIEGHVSSHSLCDLFYILRKDFDYLQRKEIIRFICENFTVIAEEKDDFIFVVDNKDWKDLEDGLQMRCAHNQSLDYIVTRNIEDFAASPIQQIEPSSLIKILS